MQLNSPTPLTERHLTGEFQCDAEELTRWLKEKALRNQIAGGTRTYVVCDEENRVIGYHALAAGSVSHVIATSAVRRNMPNPVPIIILGRLAVHADYMGEGIGKGLLKDAVLRSMRASEQIGIRAMLCHAIDENAKSFYLKHGFTASNIDPLTLMLRLPSD